MSKKSLEDRVAALELQVAALKAANSDSVRDRNIKMLAALAAFPPDNGLAEVMEFARQFREEDRRQAYEKFDRGEQPIP